MSPRRKRPKSADRGPHIFHQHRSQKRMVMPKSSKKTERIQFAYYARIAGPLGDVFRYLLRNQAHSTHKGKQMGLIAIKAFWKPFSAQAVLGLSDQEVRAVALTSIDELQKQINFIRATFNITEPSYSQTLTRRDVERMLEERLGPRRIANQSPTALPLPDNYNANH